MQTTIGTTFLNTKVTLHRFFDKSVGRDVHAVYHQDYRHCFLAEYPTSQYAYPRASGNMADDGCSYYQPHHYWSTSRSNWPAVLFQYEADVSLRNRSTPGNLVTQEGWLVLDLNSKPVKNFRMPLALSSKPEPYLLEAIARENYDQDIGVQDLRARMPGFLVNVSKFRSLSFPFCHAPRANGKLKLPRHVAVRRRYLNGVMLTSKFTQGVDKIRTGTISMARARFRLSAGLISWSGKVGSCAMKDYLDALLPPECRATNSTRDFRNLHPHEVEEMKLFNVGCFPNKARAGNKDFSDEKKQQLFEKASEKYRQKRKAFDGSTQFTPTFYKVQQVRAQREGRSDLIQNDSQQSDEESHRDVEEYEEEEYHDEELDHDDMGEYEDEDEGRSDLIQNDSQQSDEESLRDVEEYEDEDDHDMDSDADYQEFVPPTPEKVIDFRELCPTTYLQIDLISMMLEPSRLQFFYMTGVTPPVRASNENYLTLYNRLQSAFNNEIMKAEVEDYNNTLIGLTAFTDQEWTWNRPWCSEAFGTQPGRDEVSVKILEIKHELTAGQISEAPESMAAGEMTIQAIESLDFSMDNGI